MFVASARSPEGSWCRWLGRRAGWGRGRQEAGAQRRGGGGSAGVRKALLLHCWSVRVRAAGIMQAKRILCAEPHTLCL